MPGPSASTTSWRTTLLPGDVVLTGAPANSGVSRSETSSRCRSTGIGRLTPPSSRYRGRRTRGGHQPTDATAVRAVARSASDARGRQRASGLRDHRDASWREGGSGVGWRDGHRRRAAASFRAEGAEIIAMGNGAENRPRRWPLLPVRSVGESGTGETLAGPSPAGGFRAIFMPNEAERITGPAAARDGERRRSSPMSQARALSTGS